jgi:RNA polymerase sigma-70 factor (ECF subfamily)
MRSSPLNAGRDANSTSFVFSSNLIVPRLARGLQTAQLLHRFCLGLILGVSRMIRIEKEDFDEVVRRHRLPIFRFVLASVRDNDLAEDLTQECFWKAYQGWHQFRGDSSAYTWLRSIALNVIRNSVRNKTFQRLREAASIDTMIEHSCIDASTSPETHAILCDSIQRIWGAAARVSPKQQLALQLRFGREFEVHEIAAVMGITEGSVKVHLSRAVKSIRMTLRVLS